MRDILTPEQVADYLQLNTDTVYRLIRARKLAATQIGRTYRIQKEDLDQFLLANSSRPAARAALFDRIQEIGARNPEVDGDQLLEEIERMDERRRGSQAPVT